MRKLLFLAISLCALASPAVAADPPKLLHSIRTESHVKWIAVAPDGKTLVAGCDVGQPVGEGYQIRAWDLDSGKSIAESTTVKKAAAACGTISPDGKLVLSGGTFGRWHLWSLPDLKAVDTGSVGLVRVHRVAFAPDGKTFSTLGANYVKRLTDPIRESRVSYTVRTFTTATREPVGALLNWPRYRLAGEAAHLPRMREPAGWTQYGRPQFDKDGRPVLPDDAACVSLELPGEAETCGGPMVAEIALDHKRALSAGCNGSVVVWDYPARKVIGKPLATFYGLSVEEGGMFISPDGKFAAIVGRPMEGDDRPAVTVFDLDKRSIVAAPFRPEPVVSCQLLDGLALTPDGKKLAVAGNFRDGKAERDVSLIEVWSLSADK